MIGLVRASSMPASAMLVYAKLDFSPALPPCSIRWPHDHIVRRCHVGGAPSSTSPVLSSRLIGLWRFKCLPGPGELSFAQETVQAIQLFLGLFQSKADSGFLRDFCGFVAFLTGQSLHIVELSPLVNDANRSLLCRKYGHIDC